MDSIQIHSQDNSSECVPSEPLPLKVISVTTVGQRLGTCYTNMVPGRTTLNSIPSLCRNPECTAKSRLQFAKQHTVVPFSRCSSPSLRSAKTRPAAWDQVFQASCRADTTGVLKMICTVICLLVDPIRANIVIHNKICILLFFFPHHMHTHMHP